MSRFHVCSKGLGKPPDRKTVWPSGLRRWLKAPVRKGVGSNPTAVNHAVQHEKSLMN